ncbi:MAG: T9SS type A sorting domain-containing protein [Flavobacteriaceae bacterium]|nr:T9SS type A sorting domain-containing protein [Flavobacteriaceae bacterium]
MRILLLLYSLFILFSAQGQWTITSDSAGYGTYYSDMHFVNEETGYIVGKLDLRPAILRTFDSGVTWDTVYVDSVPGAHHPTQSLHDVYFPEPKIGYIVGHWDIFKSSDFGATWIIVDTLDATGVVSNQQDIIFMNKDTGFVGWTEYSNGGIMTTDGGWTWTNVPGLFGVREFNEYNGEITACADYWYELDEESLTWTAFPQPAFGIGNLWKDCIKLNGTHILLANNIYAETDDLGGTWLAYSTGSDITNRIYFHNDTLGFIAGGLSGSLKTTDGGTTWYSCIVDNLETTMPNNLKTIQMFSTTLGFGISDKGIYVTHNAGGTGIPYPFLGLESVTTQSIRVYPNPVQNILYIETGDKHIDKISLYDLSGKLVFESNQNEIDIKDLNPGSYIIAIQADGENYSKHFIKK